MQTDAKELEQFCTHWLDKAGPYRHRNLYVNRQLGGTTPPIKADTSLAYCFDRFVSLYVAFNRVYTEVGKLLITAGKIHQSSARRYAPLPDRQSATQYVVRYFGMADLQNRILSDQACREAVDKVADLIQRHVFYLHEDYRTGTPDFARDAQYADRAANYDVIAILELIYQARCNTLHGAKAFEEDQRVLLDSMSTMLEFVTLLLLSRLLEDLREGEAENRDY